MPKGIRKTGEIAPLGVRMQPELKAALVDIARHNGRSLNAEIVTRLERSFQATAAPSKALVTGEPEPAGSYRGIPTQAQEMMLDIFDRMPPDKQLALISLFR